MKDNRDIYKKNDCAKTGFGSSRLTPKKKKYQLGRVAKVNDQWCSEFIPFRLTTAEKRDLVAKNNKVQSFYQHIGKTRARDNIRDERIINDN